MHGLPAGVLEVCRRRALRLLRTNVVNPHARKGLEDDVERVADPRTMHCKADVKTCRGESYCACQCDKCKAAWEAGKTFYTHGDGCDGCVTYPCPYAGNT